MLFFSIICRASVRFSIVRSNLKRPGGTFPMEQLELFHALSIECDRRHLALLQSRRSMPLSLKVLPAGFRLRIDLEAEIE
jgi:hypothetical protein